MRESRLLLVLFLFASASAACDPSDDDTPLDAGPDALVDGGEDPNELPDASDDARVADSGETSDSGADSGASTDDDAGEAPEDSGAPSTAFALHTRCSAPLVLATSEQASNPQLAASAAGVIASWREQTATPGLPRRLVARPYDDGAWGDAETVTEQNVYSVGLAMTNAGDALAAWVSNTGSNHGERSSFTWASKSWSAVEPFEAPLALSSANTSVAANDETIALAYVVGDTVLLQSRTGNGSWTTETVADDSPIEPRVAVAPNGDLFVIWYTSGGASTWTIHARARRAGTWDPALGSAAYAFDTNVGPQLFAPAVAANGDAVIVWRDQARVLSRHFRASAVTKLEAEVIQHENAPAAVSGEAGVVMDADGDATLWLTTKDSLGNGIVRRHIGGSWGEPVDLGPSSATYVSLDADGNAAALVRPTTGFYLREAERGSHDWSDAHELADDATGPIAQQQARVAHAPNGDPVITWMANVEAASAPGTVIRATVCRPR